MTPGATPQYTDLCDIIYLVLRSIIQGGFRRGGLTPALAPRMPLITEDVVQANRGRECDSSSNSNDSSTAKAYIQVR